MASKLFAKHLVDEPSEPEIALVQRAARSADQAACGEPYDAHVRKLLQIAKARSASLSTDDVERITAPVRWPNPGVRAAVEQLLGSVAPSLPSTGDKPVGPADASREAEESRWDALVQAMGSSATDLFDFPLSASEQVSFSFLDALLAVAAVTGGGTYPTMLCAAMIANDAYAVQIAPDRVMPFLRVLEGCAEYWDRLQEHASEHAATAAAMFVMLADALYICGRTKDCAAMLVKAIELDKEEPYFWATLYEVLREQGDGAHVNIAGLGAVTAETAARAAEEAASRQRVTLKVSWPIIALTVATAAVGVLWFVRQRRRSAGL